MKALTILLVVVPLLAAGCSGPQPEFYWYHPERTLDEVRADYRECELQAKDEAVKAMEDTYFDRLRSPTDLAAGAERPVKKKKSVDPALQARAEWGALYKHNAFTGCMLSRGYVKLLPHQVSSSFKTRELPMGAIAARQ